MTTYSHPNGVHWSIGFRCDGPEGRYPVRALGDMNAQQLEELAEALLDAAARLTNNPGRFIDAGRLTDAGYENPRAFDRPGFAPGGRAAREPAQEDRPIVGEHRA